MADSHEVFAPSPSTQLTDEMMKVEFYFCKKCKYKLVVVKQLWQAQQTYLLNFYGNVIAMSRKYFYISVFFNSCLSSFNIIMPTFIPQYIKVIEMEFLIFWLFSTMWHLYSSLFCLRRCKKCILWRVVVVGTVLT